MSVDGFFDALRTLAETSFPGDPISSIKIRFASGKVFRSPLPAPNKRRQAEVDEDSDEDRPACPTVRRAILRFLEQTCKRYTAEDMREALEKAGHEISDRHLKRVLRMLQADELIDNTKDDHGTGYGLTEWPGGGRQ